MERLVCPRCTGALFHDGSGSGLVMACPSCGNQLELPGERAPGGSFADEMLELECALYGRHPVQGEGRVRGHPFYFRAKWNFWYFTACTRHVEPWLPSSIGPTGDEDGFFLDGEHGGYMLTDYFGTGQDASMMALSVAEAIVRKCAARLLEALDGRRSHQ